MFKSLFDIIRHQYRVAFSCLFKVEQAFLLSYRGYLELIVPFAYNFKNEICQIYKQMLYI